MIVKRPLRDRRKSCGQAAPTRSVPQERRSLCAIALLVIGLKQAMSLNLPLCVYALLAIVSNGKIFN
ncbi:MAG: hypothetical protein KME57_25100 [Scytonema hyalinum WJT4-NPBG1]|nr:hypothetical protein [Scytonema hyalinum WJT4-NPBG1]